MVKFLKRWNLYPLKLGIIEYAAFYLSIYHYLFSDLQPTYKHLKIFRENFYILDVVYYQRFLFLWYQWFLIYYFLYFKKTNNATFQLVPGVFSPLLLWCLKNMRRGVACFLKFSKPYRWIWNKETSASPSPPAKYLSASAA